MGSRWRSTWPSGTPEPPTQRSVLRTGIGTWKYTLAREKGHSHAQALGIPSSLFPDEWLSGVWGWATGYLTRLL